FAHSIFSLAVKSVTGRSAMAGAPAIAAAASRTDPSKARLIFNMDNPRMRAGSNLPPDPARSFSRNRAIGNPSKQRLDLVHRAAEGADEIAIDRGPGHIEPGPLE